MFYVLIGLFMAAVFGLCFLVDKLIQKVTHAPGKAPAGSVVRPARANIIWGVLLFVIGMAGALFLQKELGWIAVAAGLLLVLMGGYLIIIYCGTSIYYDEESFLYRQPGKRPAQYRFSQIRGERALLTRGGVNATLYLENGGEVNLYSSMQGTRPFLYAAYQGWCSGRGLNPDQNPPPNPDAMVWFPEPEESK